jgi:hypothetical protein
LVPIQIIHEDNIIYGLVTGEKAKMTDMSEFLATLPKVRVVNKKGWTSAKV